MAQFTNWQIEPADIPKAAETQLQPVDRKYRRIMLYHWLIFWIILLVAAAITIYFITALHSALWLGIIGLVYIVFVWGTLRLADLSFRNKAFAVREHDILYQSGWLVRSLHACPYNRIQHCSVDAGLFERRFGLSTLKLFTAAGDTELEIPGLTAAQANDLRELILQKNKS